LIIDWYLEIMPRKRRIRDEKAFDSRVSKVEEAIKENKKRKIVK